jgi:ribosome-binding protein aMBF1 (putative translation factor)
MGRSTSSHFPLRQGNRRGEWATACGRSVREQSLATVEFAEWISCSECRKAALAAKAALSGEDDDCREAQDNTPSLGPFGK